MFAVDVVRAPVTTFAVSGSVDFYSAEDLLRRLRLELLLPSCQEVTIDLSEVSFLSFEGLGVLLMGHEIAEQHGKRVRVVGGQRQPLELLELAGVSNLLVAKVSLPAAG